MTTDDSPSTAISEHIVLARHREKWLDFERAIWPYRRAIREEGAKPEYCFRLGYCYERIGNFKKSQDYYKLALKDAGCPAEWHLRSGVISQRLGITLDAQDQFSRAWAKGVTGAQAREMGVEGWLPDSRDVLIRNTNPSTLFALLRLSAFLRDRSSSPGAALDCVNEMAMINGIGVEAWLFASAALLVRGYAHAALHAKMKAADALVSRFLGSDAMPFDSIADVTAAAVYLRDFGRADAALASADGTDRSAQILAIDRLLSEGRVDEARALASEALPNDLEYRDFLDGKSCAVVGPAVNDLRSGPEIDQHDLVVRTNVYSEELIKSYAPMLGSRTDAIYYSTEYYMSRRQRIDEFLRAQRSTFVTCRHTYTARLIAKHAPDLKLRRWASRKRHNFIGIGFAFRHILLDMTISANRPISVFGADFYLGSDTHFRGYFDEGIDVLREYARHDVFDTFMFLKSLREAGAIGCDAILGAILDRDLEHLCDLIEEYH